jgi:hypothetical protein
MRATGGHGGEGRCRPKGLGSSSFMRSAWKFSSRPTRKTTDAQVGLLLHVTGRQQRPNRFSRMTVSSAAMSAWNPSSRGSPLYIAGIPTSRRTRMPARSNSRHNAAAQKDSNNPGPLCRCTSIRQPNDTFGQFLMA